MSVKTIASLVCNSASTCLLLVLFLTNYLRYCDSTLSEGVKISRVDNETFPETKTTQGTVRGINMVTRSNRTIFGFLGIPYAQPPAGDLRFKAPIPANSWNGTLNARSTSEPCPQFSDEGVLIGDEDCLYINVYTPQLPESNNSTLLPVMVFIVGGGFRTEIIAPERYSPAFLLDKDVLLVAPNFRVGVLGYLSTGDEVSPGNYGLKDIVCALKWVRDNIEYFGGDPNQVTLFGGSSGAMSAHLLTLTNVTNGLFHKLITESGTALASDLGQPKEVCANRATQLGEHLGCPTNTSTLLVNCLRKLNVSQLVDTNSLFIIWNGAPSAIWLPTHESDDIEGALLTDTPANIIAAGNIRDIPWIALVSRDEALSQTIRYYEDPDLFEDFLDNIDLALPYILGYWSKVADVQAYTDTLKSFYLNDLTANRSLLLENVTQLLGDSMFIYPTYSALQKQLVLAENPQYFTCFQYRGTFSFSWFYSGSKEYTGVVHADELIYLFGHQGERLGPADDEFSEADWRMVDTMVQLWTSFATNGTPIMVDSINTTTWEPYSSLNNYLRIGNQSDTALEMKNDLYIERMQFWDELTAATATATSGELRIQLQALPIALCFYLLSFIL